MKIRRTNLLIMLAIFARLYGANATTIFPIATNANLVEIGSGYATIGSNGIAIILAGTNVCFQIGSTNGTLIGPLTVIGSSFSFPVAAVGGGKCLVYWDDNFINAGPRVYGQIISPNGTTNGPPFLIPATGVGASRAVASDGTNFLAIWEDSNDYYGQFVTSAGTLSGSAFLITSQHQNGNSAAAIFGKTNYLVVWQSNNNDTGNAHKTYGAFVSKNGSVGSPFQISQTDSLDQNPLAIGFDGTNYLVIWNQDSQLTPSGVPVWNFYSRVVTQSGTFFGSELLLNTNQPLIPFLAFDGANYLLTWSYNVDTTNANKNVFFQFLSPSANPIGPAFTVFPSQGTNTPLFGGVTFTGSGFGVGATVGNLILGAAGGIQGFASAAAYGAFIPSSTALPKLNSTAFTNKQFSLTLTGTPGINYAVQANTNLTSSNWTMLFTNSPTNGTFSFTDTSATNKSRFYRAVKQ